MRSKWILTVFIGFLCFGLFFGIFADTIAAQEDYYKISVVDKSYGLLNIDETHGIIKYDISITLNNSGTIKSHDITVRITDEDGNYTRNGTIMPGESKTFLFNNHPLIGMTDHTILISFYPTDLFIGPNENNSGEDSLILKYGNDSGGGGTPGFEAVFLLILISLYIVIKEYKNN